MARGILGHSRVIHGERSESLDLPGGRCRSLDSGREARPVGRPSGMNSGTEKRDLEQKEETFAAPEVWLQLVSQEHANHLVVFRQPVTHWPQAGTVSYPQET